MKNIIFFFIFILLFSITLTSCWAPRCPIKTCLVSQEHRHIEPDGVYGGRPILSKWRFHNILSKKEREKRKVPNENGGTKKTKRGPKKLFDWERE